MLERLKQLAAGALWEFLSLCGLSMWPLELGRLRVTRLLICLLRAPNVIMTPGRSHITCYDPGSEVIQCPTTMSYQSRLFQRSIRFKRMHVALTP